MAHEFISCTNMVQDIQLDLELPSYCDGQQFLQGYFKTWGYGDQNVMLRVFNHFGD